MGDALETLEDEFGADSLQLVSTLFALEDVEAVADVELRIGQLLSSNSLGYVQAEPYLQSALAKLDGLFSGDHPKTSLGVPVSVSDVRVVITFELDR